MQANVLPSVWTGNFSFPHPHANDAIVEGKWISADPVSESPEAKQILKEIKESKEKAQNHQ